MSPAVQEVLAESHRLRGGKSRAALSSSSATYQRKMKLPARANYRRIDSVEEEGRV